jgi:hypothetical protein
MSVTKPKNTGPHVVRVPGELMQGEVGLGDAVKRVTSAVGISPCSACQKRAEMLNRWVTLRGSLRAPQASK